MAAQALGWTDPATGAAVLPLHTATTFLRDPDNQYRRWRSYGRADNPSYDQPQALLSALEGRAKQRRRDPRQHRGSPADPKLLRSARKAVEAATRPGRKFV